MGRILFLDDDHDRHRRFRARMETLDLVGRDRVIYAHSAAEAIAALATGEIDQAFLDHDLCEADILVAVGAPSQQPTGMAVVDHILTMARPPASLVVHSYNYEAAVEMCARLATHPGIAAQRIPFSEILTLLDSGQRLDALSREQQDNPDDW